MYYVHVCTLYDLVGVCRALLCTTSSEGLRVTQLSEPHDLSNEREVERLRSGGVDPNYFSEMVDEGTVPNLTRCLGDYRLKNEYRHVPCFRF